MAQFIVIDHYSTRSLRPSLLNSMKLPKFLILHPLYKFYSQNFLLFCPLYPIFTTIFGFFVPPLWPAPGGSRPPMPPRYATVSITDVYRQGEGGLGQMRTTADGRGKKVKDLSNVLYG